MAIEAAFILPPMVMFFLATVELSVRLIADAALLYGTKEISRLIRTGQVRTSEGLDVIKAGICDNSFGLFDCEKILFNVSTFGSFDSVIWPDPIYDDDGKVTNYGLNPGGAKKITAVKVLVPYQFLTPGLSHLFGPVDNVILSQTILMVTEPF